MEKWYPIAPPRKCVEFASAGALSRPKTKCMDHYTLSGPDSTRLILSYGE